MSWSSKFGKQLIFIAVTALIVSCSSDQESARTGAENSKNTDGSLSGSIQRSGETVHEDARYKATESPFEASPDKETARDDEAAALQEEEESEQYDEYAYEEEPQSYTVSLRKRSEGYVEWHAPTEMTYSQAEVLLISPDGTQSKHSFGPGDAMVLDETLPDGLYKWESVVTPEIDPSVREEMSAVRQSGDMQAQQELIERLRYEGSLPTEAQARENRQSGAFTVRDGVAVPTSTDVDGPGEQGG